MQNKRLHQVHLNGLFCLMNEYLLSKYALPFMQEVGGGSIRKRNRAGRENSTCVFITDYGKAGDNIPLGRIGNKDEVVKVIIFPVSDAASYVTGTAVNIEGGLAGAV